MRRMQRSLRSLSRRTRWLGVALLVAVSVVAITAAAYVVAQHQQPDSPAASATYGLPGITPHTDQHGKPIAVSPNGATFTEADVRAWYAANPEFTFSTVDGKAPTIAAIRFMTASQIAAQVEDGNMNGAPTDLQCVLILHGNFDALHVPGVPGSVEAHIATVAADPKALHVAHTEVIVFDAHTGNILTTGLQDMTP